MIGLMKTSVPLLISHHEDQVFICSQNIVNSLTHASMKSPSLQVQPEKKKKKKIERMTPKSEECPQWQYCRQPASLPKTPVQFRPVSLINRMPCIAPLGGFSLYSSSLLLLLALESRSALVFRRASQNIIYKARPQVLQHTTRVIPTTATATAAIVAAAIPSIIHVKPQFDTISAHTLDLCQSRNGMDTRRVRGHDDDFALW